MNRPPRPVPDRSGQAGSVSGGRNLQQTAHVMSLLFIGGSLALIVLFFLGGLLGSRDDFIYLAFAILMSFVPILVGFSRKGGFDLFEPINVAAGAIFLGTTLRAFYLVFMPGRPQAKFLMLHQSFEDVNRNIIWVLAGVALFCLGYLVGVKRVQVERIAFLRTFQLNLQRFNWVLVACMLLSVVGVYLYMNYFGISLSGNILAQSVKRSAEYVSESGEVVYGSGWQGQLSKAAIYGSFALATAIFARLVRITPYSLGLLAGLVLSGVFVPFLGQTRTPIILLMFNITVAAAYYGRIRTRSAVAAFLGVAMLVSAMGALRATNSYYVGVSSGFIETTVGSGNGFDSVRAAAIIDRVPENANFQYGASYLAVPFFWVPRAIWPSKPQPGLGTWVKTEVFGQWSRLAGWPPGLVADGYLNFGYFGILLVPFLFGLLLRVFYESFRPLLGVSFPATLVYISTLYTLAWNGLDLNVAAAMINALATMAPIMILLFIAARHKRGMARPIPNSGRSSGSPRAHLAQATPGLAQHHRGA